MIRKVIFILVCLVALSSCHWNGGKSSDSAELNIKVARYDRLLFEYVTMNNLSALQKMNTDFPQATKLLIEDVLAIGEVDDNKINDRLMEYYADTTLLVLIQDAEEKFKDMGWIEETHQRLQAVEERSSLFARSSFLCPTFCSQPVGSGRRQYRRVQHR